MESSVRKALSDKILADLSSQGVQKTRAQLQKVRPQILVLENLKFINDTIKELVERNHIENVSFIELTDENLRQARDIAKPHQAKYIKENKTSSSKIYQNALKDNNSNFTKTCSFNSIYNRMILFDSNQSHGVDNFDNDDNEERLTLISFFYDLSRTDGSLLKKHGTEHKRI